MTNHPNRSTFGNNRTTRSLTLPLAKIARELKTCSPELRDLVRMACTGANADRPVCTAEQSEMARMRLNEAVMTHALAAEID